MQKVFTLLFCVLLSASALYAREPQEFDSDKEIDRLTVRINKRPGDAKALLSRANLYFELEDYEAALSDYNRVIALAPKTVEAYLMASEVLQHWEDYIMAHLTLSEGIVRLPKRAELYEARAEVLLTMGNHAAALTDLNVVFALRKRPNAYAYYLRGLAYLGLRRYNEALIDFDEAIGMDPNDDEYRVAQRQAQEASRVRR